jgi:excisionase family DNA binding protein
MRKATLRKKEIPGLMKQTGMGRIQGGSILAGRRLLDIKEASHYIGLRADTVYRMVSHRRIPFVKVGRRTMFDVQLLNGWLAENTVLPIPRKVA